MPSATMCGEIAAFAWLSSTGRPWRYVLKDDVAEAPVYLVMEAQRITAQTLDALLALPADRVMVVVGTAPTEDEWGILLDKGKVTQFASRCKRVGTWQEVARVLSADTELAEGLGGVYELPVPCWSPDRGSFSYHIPSPKIEVRKTVINGKMLVALINHTPQEFAVPLPWFKGQDALELTGTGKERFSGDSPLTLRAYDFRLLQPVRANVSETH